MVMPEIIFFKKKINAFFILIGGYGISFIAFVIIERMLPVINTTLPKVAPPMIVPQPKVVTSVPAQKKV